MNLTYGDLMRIRIAELKKKEFTIYDLNQKHDDMSDKQYVRFLTSLPVTLNRMMKAGEITLLGVKKPKKGTKYVGKHLNLYKVANLKKPTFKHARKHEKEMEKKRDIYERNMRYVETWKTAFPALFKLPQFIQDRKFTVRTYSEF